MVLELYFFWAVFPLQSAFHPMVYSVKHGAFIDKPHFQLGGMNVHIHCLKRHFQMQHTGGEFSHHDTALKRFFQRSHGSTAFYTPAVDKKLLHAPVGAAVARPAHKAPHPHMIVFIVHRHQAIGKITPIHRINRRLQFSVAGGVKLFLSLPDKPHGDFGMRKGDFIQHTGYGVGFGHVFF